MTQAGQPASADVTVMIRHIPCRYTNVDIKRVLDGAGLRGTFSYIYAPRIEVCSSNVGYAFVRFVSLAHAEECARRLGDRPFGQSWSQKVCSVELARFQGDATQVRSNQTGEMPDLLFCSVRGRGRGRRSRTAFTYTTPQSSAGPGTSSSTGTWARAPAGAAIVGRDPIPTVGGQFPASTNSDATPLADESGSAGAPFDAGVATTNKPQALSLTCPVTEFFYDVTFEGIQVNAVSVGLMEGVTLPPRAPVGDSGDFGLPGVQAAPLFGQAGSTAPAFFGHMDGMRFHL